MCAYVRICSMLHQQHFIDSRGVTFAQALLALGIGQHMALLALASLARLNTPIRIVTHVAHCHCQCQANKVSNHHHQENPSTYIQPLCNLLPETIRRLSEDCHTNSTTLVHGQNTTVGAGRCKQTQYPNLLGHVNFTI